jgi:hypothetical protein
MKNNPYVDPPSGYVVVGWIVLLISFFWLLVWGLKYIGLGLLWLVSFI